MSLICRILTPTLLIASLILTILPLLPSPLIPLFTIRPTGSPLPRPLPAIPTVPSSTVSGSISGIPDLGSIPPIYNVAESQPFADISNVEAVKAYLVPGAGAPVIRPDLPPTLCMGDNGPTIHVGALRVCSQATQGTEEICERLSRYAPGLENAVMPLSLSAAMSFYPTSSPGPILLVISASFQILAILCFLLDLIPWFRLVNCIQYRQSTRSRKAYPTTDSESAFGLVQDPPLVIEKGTRKPWGFLFFWTLAFGLSLGGVGVVLMTVSEAAGRWDEGLAKEVGMKFRVRAGCYLIGSIPLVMFLAGLTGVIPFVQELIKRYRSQKTASSSGPRQPVAAASSENIGRIMVKESEEQLGAFVSREDKEVRIKLEPIEGGRGQAR